MKYFKLPIIQHYWSAVLASAIAFVWIFFYTKHSGIGISPDSVSYLSTANHIVHGFFFTDYNHQPFVNFPLGYPIFLAVLHWFTSIPLLAIAPFTNSFLFAMVLFISNSILYKIKIESGLLRLIVLLLLLSSSPLLEVYSMLWSETLFIVICLLFFYSLYKYGKTISMKWLLISALLASLATEVRYIGVTVIITGGIFILLGNEIGFAKKIMHFVVFSVLGCSIPSINVFYNKLNAGTWAGMRQLSNRSFNTNLLDFEHVFTEWFPLPKGYHMVVMMIGICLFICYGFYQIYAYSRQKITHIYIPILSCFTIVYGAFMLLIATVSRFEVLSSRLISPIFIPLMMVLIYYIGTGVQCKLGWWKKAFIMATIIFFCLQIHHHYRLQSAAWEGIDYAGIPGYTEDQWTNSSTIYYLKKEYRDYTIPIYSNANDAIYFLTNLPSLPLPHKDSPAEIFVLLQQQSFYLVWFKDGHNSDLINIEYIHQQKKIKHHLKFDDGSVFYFTNK